jgi:hypothetical protein
MNTKSILSISDVTKATGLCRTLVYRAIKDGLLEAKKYGARTLITAIALEAFITNLPNKSLKGKANGKKQ